MAWNDNLDGVHADIAADDRTPIHVLAGPGTGKTTAMMRRVARLLEGGADPKTILAVTFTRTAARDLSRQLLALDLPQAGHVNACTLHSLCFSILLAEAAFRATGRRARPLLSHEIEQMVNDLAPRFGGKRKVKHLIEAYEAAWARLQTEDPGSPKDALDVAFEAALLDWLRYHGAMLVGELVPITLRYLRDNQAAETVPVFKAVLVDEFQDLNKADQSLIEVLAKGGSLTVIGDDNQSIYSFRYANPEGIRTFAATHPHTVPYVIEECRRCPPNIVLMSNELMRHDPDSRPTLLTPQKGRPDATVYVVQHESIEDEADAIAGFVRDFLDQHPDTPPGQVLVLSPRRLFGNAVRDALISRRLNALSFFWEDQLSAISAAEGFCLLVLKDNRYDRAAYRAWIGLGRDDGFEAAYRRLRERCQEDALEPFDLGEMLAAGKIAIAYAQGLVERHKELVRRLEAISAIQGMELVDALWGDTEDNRAIRLVAGSLSLDVDDPKEFLRGLTEAITRPELPDAGGDVIRVMSLHKSKGLTAEVVVVVGCVNGAIPAIDDDLAQPLQDAMLKEQRRLFYVAVTRAKQVLVLSYARKLPLSVALKSGVEPVRIVRERGETKAITAATPFLAELGGLLPAALRGPDWRAALNI